MVYLFRTYNPLAQGFVVSLDPDNPMGIIVGSGAYGEEIITEAVSITFPIMDVKQSVDIKLCDDVEFPIEVVSLSDGRHPGKETCILILANFVIPADCSDLRTIDIYVWGFAEDKLHETAFEGGEPMWEAIG